MNGFFRGIMIIQIKTHTFRRKNHNIFVIEKQQLANDTVKRHLDTLENCSFIKFTSTTLHYKTPTRVK